MLELYWRRRIYDGVTLWGDGLRSKQCVGLHLLVQCHSQHVEDEEGFKWQFKSLDNVFLVIERGISRMPACRK